MLIKCGNVDITDRVLSCALKGSFSDNQIIGQCPSFQLDLKLNNKDGFFNNKLDELFYYTESGYTKEYVYVAYDRPERYTKELSLKLYDRSYELDIAYDTNLDYRNKQITILDQLREMERLTGFNFDVSNIHDDVLSMIVKWYDNTVTIRTYLKWIGELFAANIFANSINSFKFVQLSKNVKHTTMIASDYQKDDLFIISRICFDNSVIKAEKGTMDNNTLYISYNNPYIESGNANKIVDYIYNVVGGLQLYSLNSMKTKNIADLHLGDIVNYNDEFNFMVLSIVSKVTSATTVVQSLTGKMTSKNEEKLINRIDNTTRLRMLRVEFDQAELKWSITAQQTEENKEQIASQKLTIDSITSTISDVQKDIEEIDATSYTVSNLVSATSITKDNTIITMSAKVYKSGEDVTDSTLATAFNWIRVSKDTEADTLWNNNHKSLKVITLTKDDVSLFANFECKVTLSTGTLETGYTTIKNEIGIGSLNVSLSCNKPSYQLLNDDGTLFPEWNPMTITPECAIDGVHVDLNEVTITFKRKLGDSEESDLIDDEVVENGILSVSSNMLSTTNPLITYVCYATKEVDTYKSTFSFALSKNGAQGPTGSSVTNMIDEFYLSDSKDEQTGGEWSETCPAWESGKFLWKRTKITYSNPQKTEYSTAFVDSTWEATNQVKDELITNDNKIYNEITENYSTEIEQLKNSIISMVSESYATESELVSAVENLTSQIVQNSTSITATTTAVKEVTDKMTGLATKEEISQWATFESGVLKLASSNSAFSVRLSQSELGFYQGETRIAYLSNQQLYITQAVILRSIRMNNFVIDDDPSLGFIIH